jgi:hypothetical protein
MYLKVKNGAVEQYPYSIENLRKENPEISFPKTLSNDFLSEWGIFLVNPTEKPTIDYHTQTIKELTPINSGNGWFQAWSVEQISEDVAKENIRNRRNYLLAQTDWTQIADATVDKTVWAAYRQELRDISTKNGFPFNVIWPTKPE